MHLPEDDRPAREILVSVDVETSGPSPSVASLLAVGACLVDDPSEAIYLELRPEADRGWDDAASRARARARSAGAPWPVPR